MIDLYTELAKKHFGVTQPTKEQRDFIKHNAFRAAYGMKMEYGQPRRRQHPPKPVFEVDLGELERKVYAAYTKQDVAKIIEGTCERIDDTK